MARVTPPRFAVRTLIVTLATVAFVLSAVLLVVTLKVRDRVRDVVIDKLETRQKLLVALEERRAKELQAQVAMLAENSTLKAALDTYQTELQTTNAAGRQDLVATIGRELDKLAERIKPDVLEVRDQSGAVLGVSGRRAGEWPADARVSAAPDGSNATFVTIPAGVFRIASVPVSLQGTELGTLRLANALDERYALELSDLSRAQTLIVSGDRVIASTLPPAPMMALTPQIIRAMVGLDVVTLGDSEYAVKRLVQEGAAQVYVLDSIDASARPVVQGALRTMGGIALGAFALAALASLWLARTIARPIDALSSSLSAMSGSRDFDHPLTPGGESLEVDTLTVAFNTMMHAVRAAEAETLSAYLGTIRALALALDARDPYTAGHSERVSAVSLAIGRCMSLDAGQLEVLRLGALLHDIGKIGISDHVLMKPGALTAEEYEIIKQHPGVGARILRSVPFLEPHIPIVELHHERPDGKGYPHGLHGREIPLVASIVHVADAFDAMTSARAYRPARATAEGLRELWRCAGSQFDAEVVQALAKALPDIDLSAVDNAARTPVAAPMSFMVAGGSLQTAVRTAVAGAVAIACVTSASARAQDVTGRVAMEAVVSASASSANHDPFLIFDAVNTVSVGHGWDAVIRPWAKRMPGGEWGAEMYQLQLRYTSSTRIPFRIDAGIISSPMGLATLELRADRNPTIGAPFYYFVPLPPFDGHFDRVTLMSGGYPLGAVVSASGARWDVRGGVTDATPTRSRNLFSAARAPAASQIVMGGGVTPTPGLRLGIGFARGRYRSIESAAIPDESYEEAYESVAETPKRTSLPEQATVFNIEGEYAIGYTRISGEWIVDRFDTTISPAIARGFNLQAVRTLTPRWFAAGRTVRASSPVLTGPTPGRRTATSAEANLGYRVTTSFTVRGGYQGSSSLYNPKWNHALAVSAVWSQRWW